MAKKKKSGTKKRNKGFSTKGGDFGIIAGSMLYGAGRGYLSNLIKPLTDKVPLGGFADEVALGFLSYYARKGKLPFIGKSKLVRDIGTAGLVIESARLGDAVFQMVAPQQAQQQTNGLTQTVF